jgi:hypothetical protein
MEELHTDSIDGGHEGQLWARSRVRERAYSNNIISIYRRHAWADSKFQAVWWNNLRMAPRPLKSQPSNSSSLQSWGPIIYMMVYYYLINLICASPSHLYA